MKKKAITALLATAMTMGVLAGCADAGEVSTDAQTSSEETVQTDSAEKGSEAELSGEITYPMESDVTLRIYIGGGQPLSNTFTDYKDVPFWQGLIENTGINCEWQFPAAGADATASYNLMLQDEQLPHLVMGYHMNASGLAELIEDGVVLDVTGYLPQYAPDYYNWITAEENAKNLRQIAAGEGIPAFQSARNNPWGCTYTGPLIRQDWLNALGLEVPSTIEEVEEVLHAFKDSYNAFYSSSQTRGKEAFIGALGAFAGQSQRWYLDGDQVKYANEQPENKEWLSMMNRWYQEGILDPNFAAADDAYAAEMAMKNKMGMSYSAISQQTKWLDEAAATGSEAAWIGFSNPTNAAGDPVKYIQTEYSTGSSFGVYATTACETEEEIAAALGWVNWAYTDDGAVYWNFGTEGVSFETVDGARQFTDLIKMDDRGIEQALRDYTGASAMPVGIQLEEFVRAKNSPAAGDSVDAWVANQVAADYIVPGLPLTSEEQMILSDISTAMSTYVAEMSLKFIMGEEKLDNFDSYVQVLNSMGLEKAKEIQNAAYQRFLSGE